MQLSWLPPETIASQGVRGFGQGGSYPECHRFKSYLSHFPGGLEIKASGIFFCRKQAGIQGKKGSKKCEKIILNMQNDMQEE